MLIKAEIILIQVVTGFVFYSRQQSMKDHCPLLLVLVVLLHDASAASCNDWPSTCPGTLPRMQQTWMMNLR